MSCELKSPLQSAFENRCVCCVVPLCVLFYAYKTWIKVQFYHHNNGWLCSTMVNKQTHCGQWGLLQEPLRIEKHFQFSHIFDVSQGHWSVINNCERWRTNRVLHLLHVVLVHYVWCIKYGSSLQVPSLFKKKSYHRQKTLENNFYYKS